MQLLEKPHRRLDDTDRAFALLEGALERPLQRRRITLGGRKDRVVDTECRTVADAGDRIIDADPAAVARIERELLELGAAQAAIPAKARDQVVAGVRSRRDLVARQPGRDELAALAGAAGGARPGHRGLGALAG